MIAFQSFVRLSAQIMKSCFIGNDQSCVLIPVPITLSEVLSVDQAHTVHRGRMLNPNDNSYCHYLDHCQYTVRGRILNPNDDCC